MMEGADWDSLDWKSIGIAAGSGAISGAVGATGVGLLGQIAVNASLSAAESFITDAVYEKEIDWANVAYQTGIGALAGRVGGAGLKHGLKTSSKQIVNISKKYFSTITLTYTNAALAQTMGKEFFKGAMTCLGADIIIEFVDNVIRITYPESKKRADPLLPGTPSYRGY